MKESITGWIEAPNRHLEPVWAAAFRLGVLHRVNYAGAKLGWTQLGTEPRFDPAYGQHIGAATQSRCGLDDLVRESSHHLVAGIGEPFVRAVLRACFRTGRKAWLLVECLKPRHPLSPVRWVRNIRYRDVLAKTAGVFTLGRRAAIDFAELGVPRGRVFPGMYVGPAEAEPRQLAAPGRIVYCGRLIRHKGIDTLIEALLALRTTVPAELEIIGDGPDRGRLQQLGRGAPVRFLGVLDSREVMVRLSHASVLVLPTAWKEGWGYVVNEAIAAGLPVVVSDVVGAKEIVIPGRTGEVFRPGSAAELSQALGRALDLHRRSDALAADLRVARSMLDPEPYVRWMWNTMLNPDRPARAPWHDNVDSLGGNDEIRWWDEFKGRANPREGASVPA